jgi:tetratricopeptide (TPR) repeat protein
MARRHFPLLTESFVLTCACTLSALAAPPGDGENQVTATADTELSAREGAAAEDTAPEGGAPEETHLGPDPFAEAKHRVARAEKLFDDGNYDAALAEFQRTYETMEGHAARHVVLYNIGQCFEKLYRYDAAIAAYRDYLEQGGNAAEDAPTVRAKLELLEDLLGVLKITVTSGHGPVRDFEVWVDGRLVAKNATSLSLPGGNHQVEVRASGFTAEKAPVQLPARSERALSFSLEPLAAEYHGLPPGLFWTATGLAVASAVTGGVFAMLATSDRSEVDAQRDKGGAEALREVREEDRSDIETKAVTADIFFASAGVFAVGAVALGFMTDFGGDERTEQKASGGTQLDLRVAPGGGSFAWGGTF